ncbi:MAG: 3-phosphoshikimate 1-carboxyvinyltransferase [Coxiellaceae bacterium]|nr:3-phosphoshikimate 1-carboxyvinyltransferase [Coxiellaceae bacterium]|tara:strand:+ start:7508 stop:8794 length:1287 start_codon:yes stop_codon:yes gene_type:complete
MQNLYVQKSQLSGTLHLPASKSHTMRALLFATLAEGTSVIHNPLPSPDTEAMIMACQQLGAKITHANNQLTVIGTSGNLKKPQSTIDAGNSGQVLRFIACLAGLQPGRVDITGDHSICHSRPVKPLLSALNQLGLTAQSIHKNNHPPISIQGSFTSSHAELDGSDSQPVSGLLMAAAFRDQITTHLTVSNPGETPWVLLTIDWLQRLGFTVEQSNFHQYAITGKKTIPAFNYTVPSDISAMAFPLVAALITQSTLTLSNIDLNDPQGDKAILDIVQRMGAQLTIDAEQKTVTTHPSPSLHGITIDINHCIDTLPILSVLGCFAQGTTQITGATIARFKESNRIEAMHTELSKMGADITVTDDGLIIRPTPLRAANVDSHHDHRIAMACAVAGLALSEQSVIKDTDCIAKSFPNFAQSFKQINANISLV